MIKPKSFIPFDESPWEIGGGWLEIATADDGTEPIYVRQYGGYRLNGIYSSFGTIIRSATLLDASGNTSFPGTVTASAFTGNASSATKATQDGKGNVIADTYVLKEDGKGLSTNDYTNDEKTKLDSIKSGAEVNVQSNCYTPAPMWLLHHKDYCSHC